MTEYEKDFIYKILPRLTNSIDNLAEKVDKLNQNKTDKFYQTLEEAGITVEDFTGHIGVILGTNTAEDPEDDKKLIDAAWEFMRELYKIGTHCL